MRTRTWSCTSATIKTALKLHGSMEPETSGYVFSLFDGCKKLQEILLTKACCSQTLLNHFINVKRQPSRAVLKTKRTGNFWGDFRVNSSSKNKIAGH